MYYYAVRKSLLQIAEIPTSNAMTKNDKKQPQMFKNGPKWLLKIKWDKYWAHSIRNVYSINKN